jgi:hypothetical protein
MSQNAKLGKGSTFTWNNIKVNDVKKIGSIPLENTEVDVTDLDSLVVETISGLKDYGTIDIEGFYTATAGQIAMEADAKSGITREVEINLVNLGKKVQFYAWVKSFKFGEASPKDPISFTATLRITSEPSSLAADLSALTISDGTLTPAFSATKYNYVAITTAASMTITPTLADAVITITANGVSQVVASGVASSAITLTQGAVTPIVITVAKNGGISTYTISAGDLA